MESQSTLGKIIIVDKEPAVIALLKYNLIYEGFSTMVFDNADCVKLTEIADSQLVIVDAMDQTFNALDLIRDMRNEPETLRIPVMVCTARDNESLKLEAFNLGADDFVVKPFSLREVIARVKAIVRRRPKPVEKPQKVHTGLTIKHLGLYVDTEERHVSHNGVELPLTKTEYSILEFLLIHINSFYTRDEIYAEVWKEDNDPSNIRIVDTNISRLRKKLGDCGKYIINRYGLGYGFFDRAV